MVLKEKAAKKILFIHHPVITGNEDLFSPSVVVRGVKEGEKRGKGGVNAKRKEIEEKKSNEARPPTRHLHHQVQVQTSTRSSLVSASHLAHHPSHTHVVVDAVASRRQVK